MDSNKTKNIIFSLAFLFSIAIPFPLFIILNGGFDVENIKLNIKESPELSIFKAIDNDFKAKYGLRKLYLKAHTDFKYYFLNESAIPKKVVVGKAGWFYVGNRYSNTIIETLKSSTFTLDEKHIALRRLNARNIWLDSIGVSYYTCVAPSKLSIYPDYYYSKQLEGNSKFEDLKLFLAKNNWNLIDLKRKILQKRDSIRLYHKTDSHWNDEGAYLGYLTLMEELSFKYPSIVPVSLSNFTRLEIDSVDMDLSNMLGLDNIENLVVYRQQNPDITELKRRYSVTPGFDFEDWKYEIRYKNKNGLPFKVMLFRDSFSTAWLKYLTETFEEVILIWDREVVREMVEKENPDILIQEVIERDIEVFLE